MMFRDVSGTYNEYALAQNVVVASALSKDSKSPPPAAMPPAKEKGSGVLVPLLGLAAFFAVVLAIDLYGEKLKRDRAVRAKWGY